MNQAPHVAIVGATGAVGVEILSCLETRNFPVGSLKLLASARSAGKQVAFRGEMLTVEELTEKLKELLFFIKTITQEILVIVTEINRLLY